MPAKPDFRKTLVQIAVAEVGVTEVDGTNCGPRVNIYKAATNLAPYKSWKWCAGFVCWAVREALTKCGLPTNVPGFTRPTTAGAWDFINWSQQQDDRTHTLINPKSTDIWPGDIIVFTFSHIGIATDYAAGNVVLCVEGNTSPDNGDSNDGGGVFTRRRPLSKVKARIRFNL